MTNPNPFPGLWREQHLLVIERGCSFPQRCVCCDSVEAEPDSRFTKTQRWHELKSNTTLFGCFYRCQSCAQKTARLWYIELGSCAVPLLMAWSNELLWNLCFVAPLITWICCRQYRTIIELEKLDEEKAWFSGFPPAFLDQLPDFRERRKSRQDADEPSGEPT